MIRRITSNSLLWLMMAYCCHAASPDVNFTQDVLPILSDHCYACHGPDEEHRQGGFRLDKKQGAFGKADSGALPIVPGEPAASELMRRINTNDVELRMPPATTNKALTADEIDLLRRWIHQGASWNEPWSLVPPEAADLPIVQNTSWPENPVDYFVLARLEEAGLKPSPKADKVNLIRRVTFDLTGLPPTVAEVDGFLADNSAEGYAEVVDRLLQSPRYGEHMARYWLDAVRYGDTHGLHLDNYREIWPYRDWIIQAFNNNMPFDHFAVQQLAGDLLPNPSRDQLVATGFLRSNVTTNEGGSIRKEVHVRNVVDRVVTVGTVFMGMTLDCSRCHDHKFDPVTMDDFYSLFAFFNSIDGSPMDGNRKDHAPIIRVPSAEQQRHLDRYDQQIAATLKRLRAPWPEIDTLQQRWEEKLMSRQRSDNSQPPAVHVPANNPVILGDWYTVGPFNDAPHYIFQRRHGPEGKTVRLEDQFTRTSGEDLAWERRPEWTDGKPYIGLPGNVAVNFLFRTMTVNQARQVTISLGSGDNLKVFLNNKQILGKDAKRSVAADQETVELALQQGENQLLLKIGNYGGESGFYFALPSAQPSIPKEIASFVSLPTDDRSVEQVQQLRDFFRGRIAVAAALEKVRADLWQLRAARAELDRHVPTTLIWRESAEPRPAHLLKRGQYDQPGHAVKRRTPVALPPMDADHSQNRLGFAQWLFNPAHPLTARVTVNRLWQQLFGTGLVKTAEDFGSQGEPPSHPELLDWLATTFREDGWDMQAMMKRLVMSKTYRQSSVISHHPLESGRDLESAPENSQRRILDPENRLLARGPRFRLDAEMLRDQALFISGLLVEKIGGHPVKPPQPDGLWYAVGYTDSDTVRFVADRGTTNIHRRTLYTFIKRTAPPPQMSILDAPSRESCVVRRERTNTPLMSLMLFNDSQYVAAARALGEQTMRKAENNDRSRAAYMFRLCTCRKPTAEELNDLVRGFEEQLAHYATNLSAAKKLVTVGELPFDETLEIGELAAWTMIANMLLCTDEVVTKN